MRIVITTVQTPFIMGGAELHAKSLQENLIKFGHETEIVTFPFKFSPEKYISDLMEFISKIKFDQMGWVSIDKLIALKFPAYYVRHSDKTIWLLHQHRAAYDLFDEENADEVKKQLRKKIRDFDNSEFAKCDKIFTNSRNVSDRLKKYNNINSIPLYHPPFDFHKFYPGESLPYIFYPGRQENLKRQDLLIEAMKYVKSDVKLLLSGNGGKYAEHKNLIDNYGLNNKVQMLGHISDNEKYSFYANALAVAYPPFDEDYGYVSLEAMLSEKPLITCEDSGGPLEFVIDGVNGFVSKPDPKELASKMDWFYNNKSRAVEMGKAGKKLYYEKNINWENVINNLIS